MFSSTLDIKRIGLSLKSLTGSKKILTVLSRMGHSLNQHAVEKIEINFVCSILGRQLNCIAVTASGVVCGLAFDNYEELTHTIRIRHLHYTMGILYQTQGR